MQVIVNIGNLKRKITVWSLWEMQRSLPCD